MTNNLLHYEALAEFKAQFYKDLLTFSHLEEGEIFVDRVTFADGTVDDRYDFWGYKFVKDGKKYLLPCFDDKKKEISLHRTLPIKVNQEQKLAYRGDVYYAIMDYSSANPAAKQTMTFKQLVDSLASFSHSNPEHYKLLWMMGLTQMMSRANFRVCSPAGFGKDSVVATLGHLIGGCAAIVKPSRAKLEYRAIMYKWLAVNEVTRVPKADWEMIEPFLLDSGAMLPSIEKQTRGFDKVGESMDISQLSLTLMYNDIDHIGDQENFLDFKAHKALLDRFPPLRFHGTFTQDFSETRNINVKQMVADNFGEYRKLLNAFTYYKANLMNCMHNYDRSALKHIASERWKYNIKALLNVVDLYSESQEEFNKWLVVINDAMDDYACMLSIKESKEAVKKKLTHKEYVQVLERFKNMSTYKSRVELLNSHLKEGVVSYSDDKGLW